MDGSTDKTDLKEGNCTDALSLMSAGRALFLSGPIVACEVFWQSACAHTAMKSIEIVRNKINHLAKFLI